MTRRRGRLPNDPSDPGRAAGWWPARPPPRLSQKTGGGLLFGGGRRGRPRPALSSASLVERLGGCGTGVPKCSRWRPVGESKCGRARRSGGTRPPADRPRSGRATGRRRGERVVGRQSTCRRGSGARAASARFTSPRRTARTARGQSTNASFVAGGQPVVRVGRGGQGGAGRIPGGRWVGARRIRLVGAATGGVVPQL